MADADELGTDVLRAVGAPSAAVHRASDTEIWLEFLDGRVGIEGGLSPARDELDSREGVLLGLADALMVNPDRSTSNWMRVPRTGIVGFDQGWAFRMTTPGAAYSSPFARRFILGNSERAEWAEKHDMTPSDMAKIRRQLEALREKFMKRGRLDWWNAMMKRMDILEAAASGTVDRL